jgi:hypothetical protein
MHDVSEGEEKSIHGGQQSRLQTLAITWLGLQGWPHSQLKRLGITIDTHSQTLEESLYV